MAQTTILTLADAHTVGFELVKRHTDRFVSYVTSLGDAAAGAMVPGSDWTVGMTIAHLQSVYGRYTTDHRRSPRSDLVAQNAEDVARLGIDVSAATSFMREQLAFLEPVVAHIEPDRQFPFHAGQTVTMAGGWGNLLGELLAHGDDIARATGSPFTIPSADTEILWRFTAPILQGWLRAEAVAVRESFRLEFPFGPINVGLDGGVLRWGDDDIAEADHHIVIDDAAELALAFPYRRRPIHDATVALLASRFYDV